MSSKHRAAHRVAFWLALVVVAFTRSAAAAPDDATRSAAHALGEEGMALAEKGDQAGALDRFDRAFALMRVPTLALMSGRALEKLGRLVEASERYRQATVLRVDPDLPQAFRQTQIDAQADATHALEALRPRIPKLRIVVEPAGDVEVTIDEKPLARSLVGVFAPADPGRHVIAGRRGRSHVKKTVSLAEGARENVTLELPKSEAPAAARSASRSSKPPPPSGGESGSERRTAGFVSLGIGGVGAVVGATSYLVALGKSHDLDGQCKDGKCPPSASADLDAYRRAKTVTTVGFIVAGVGFGAGAALLVLGSQSSEKNEGSVAIVLGPGSASVAGTFR